MRRKTKLLSRVSALALIAAAGAVPTAEPAQAACEVPFEVPGDGTVINTNQDCVVVNEPVEGDVENRAIVGSPGDGIIPFHVYADISGQLINDGSITGGFYSESGEAGALTIDGGATIAGGVLNEVGRAITSTSGNAIQIGSSGDGYSDGHVEGGIVNKGTISSGQRYGIAALYGSLSGSEGAAGLSNEANATIFGGRAGVYVGNDFAWSDGILNAGTITGISDAGIQIGDGDEGDGVAFAGGITNASSGIIESPNGSAIWITNDVATFTGGIHNANDIEGGWTAISIQAETFSGGIHNNSVDASIVSSAGDAIYVGGPVYEDGVNWTGDFTNQGLVEATGLSEDAGSGFAFYDGNYTGNFTNTGIYGSEDDILGGIIRGNVAGVHISTDGAINAGLDNNEDPIKAQFRNTGEISGVNAGMIVIGGEVHADFTNTSDEGSPAGVISASGSEGVGLYLAAENWTGDIVNDGTIRADAPSGTGMVVAGVGDCYEYECVTPYSFAGTITNAGTVNGGATGLYVSWDSFTGDIVNQAGGRIEGGATGAEIYVGAFNGDITNSGEIIGGGFDTGLHIVTAGTHTGNIVNSAGGLIEATDNALHVDITNLVVAFDEEETDVQTSGLILNDGTIRSTGFGEYGPPQTAVRLQIDNGATFVNDGEIAGHVEFDGAAAYTFIGQQGSIIGDLVGEGVYLVGNNDHIIVRNGEQYFAYGTASNFASFTVEEGGVAVMGGNGSGYAFANVNALNVNDGGTLFIDRPTTLVVDGNYTQQEGGALAFFLGAPEGIADATGTIEAGNSDYGQLDVNGTAYLNGRISGELDSAFSSANPGLETVVYNDVIVANEIEGSFDTTELLSNSAFFQLNYSIEDVSEGRDNVDLFVTRTPLGQLGLSGLIVESLVSFDNAVSDRSNGMGSGSCGLAGEGWCFNRFAANEPGATQVMTDATPGADPFAWLRTGVRRVGETAAWGRLIGVWGETDGDATLAGSDFDSYGGIVGIDHVFTPILLAGVAAQWTTTDIDFKGRPDNADVDSLEVGAYVSYGDARLYLNANASFIWHDFDVRRVIGPDQAFGDYDGTTFSMYAEGGKTFETYEGMRIQPFVALSYSHLNTDSYSETGTNANTLLAVQDSDFDSLKSIVGARLAYPIDMPSGRKVVPEVRAAWSHEFMDDQSVFLANLQTDPPATPPARIVGEEYSRDTLVLGTGVSVPLSEQTVAFVDYDAGLNNDVTTHAVSVGLRVRW